MFECEGAVTLPFAKLSIPIILCAFLHWCVRDCNENPFCCLAKRLEYKQGEIIDYFFDEGYERSSARPVLRDTPKRGK